MIQPTMANARQKNLAPTTLVGPSLTERPLATSLELGTEFVNETSGEKYRVVRAAGAAAGAHSWKQVGYGPAAALPVSFDFSGGLAAGTAFNYLVNNVGTANAQGANYPVPAAGTIQGFEIYVRTNTSTIDETVSVVRSGGAGISIVVPAGQTGAFSSAATVAVGAGETVAVSVAGNPAPGSIELTAHFVIAAA